MRKMRILALLLAVLMIPFSVLVACKKDTEEDPCAEGHEWNKKEVTVVKRTCTESGVKERTCKVCKITEEYEWKPEGHTIARAEWIYNEDATCTKDGTMTRSCALCTYSETETMPNTMIGHVFNYYVLAEDGYSETSVCDICSVETNTRLVGINVDFEGKRDTLSYGSFCVYTAEGITAIDKYLKTETLGEKENTYLQIDRTDVVGIGDHGYGALLAPGYNRLKENRYVVEFDIKISESTGDMVLLSGVKDLATVDFLTYDADTKTVSITYGPVYILKESDLNRWLKVSVVLNDIEQQYEFYLDNKLVMSGIEYQNEGYFAGMALENFKIAMTHEVGVASTFALDNIDIYNDFSPKGYEGLAHDKDFDVFETEHSKDKIMYKKLTDGCSHNLVNASVAATCFTDGYTYQECDKCHGLTALATGDAKHEHKNSEGKSALEKYGEKAATCTEYGATFYKCTLPGCDYKFREPIQMEPHEIDTTAPSYLNKPADCLNDGVITGECKNCQCAMSLFNGEYKTGHNIVDIKVVKEADCDEDGYSTGVCINPGCGNSYTVDEVPALGHVMKSKIVKGERDTQVIETSCIRCESGASKTTQPLFEAGSTYPSVAQMSEALGDRFFGGTDGDAFNNGNFALTVANKLQMRFANNNTQSTGTRMQEGGDYFLRIKHVVGDKESYLNILDGNMIPNADVVVELSLRLPKSGTIASGTMTAAQRITGHNTVFQVFSLDADGNIKFIPGNCIIGKLTSERFIKLSFVIKPGTGAVDAYFDGELKVQNALMKTGEVGFVPDGGTVYEFRFNFGVLTAGERSLDVDDMYFYQASMPYYVTNPFIGDAAETEYSTSNNSTDAAGPYLNNAGKVIGNNISVSSNKNFRAYAEEIELGGETVTALHCLKGDNVTTITSALNQDDSNISTYGAILRSGHAVIYNKIKFNSGSFTEGNMNPGTMVLAQGVKEVSDTVQLQDFLVLKDGELRAGDGKYLENVTENQWITYEVVVDEGRSTYDIYINGKCRASGVRFNKNYVAEKYSQCGYKFLSISGGNFDFYMIDTALYAGAVAPISDVTIGEVERVTVETNVHKFVDAVVFSADRSVSSYYNYIGKMTVDGNNNLVPATTGAVKGSVSNGQIDRTENNKAEKINVLKTYDYKTNNLTSLEFKTLVGVKLASADNLGTYDLSGYDYLTVSFYVEKTDGYNVIFKLNTANEDNYYQIRFYVNKTGWQTVKLPLNADPDHPDYPYFKRSNVNFAGDLKDVTSISVEFAGSIAGSGNGALKDGTSIAFEKFVLEEKPINKSILIGENIKTEEECKHDHVFTTVLATCESTGYKKGVCSKCDHVAVTGKVDPLKDVKGEEKTKSTYDACKSDGIKVARYTCSCGDDYYCIIEYIPAGDHENVDGTCSGCDRNISE